MPDEQNCDLGFLEKSLCKAQTVIITTEGALGGTIRPDIERPTSGGKQVRLQSFQEVSPTTFHRMNDFGAINFEDNFGEINFEEYCYEEYC